MRSTHVFGTPARSAGQRVTAALVGVVSAVCLAACQSTVTPAPADPATLVQESIDAINAAPGAWQAATSSLIDKLDQSTATVLAEVQSVYNDAIGQAENVTMCTVDFFGHRVSEGLATVLHHISPSHPAPQLTPTVCHTDPSQYVTAGTTKLVTYYGYDFEKFGHASPFFASIVYAGGQVVTSGFAAVNITHNYEMDVEFQAFDFSHLDASKHPSIVLSWTDQPVKTDGTGASSAIPVILPIVPPPSQYAETDIAFSEHVDPSPWWQTDDHCQSVEDRRLVGMSPGWRVDTTKGDAGHPGVSQVAFSANEQAKATLRAYDYRMLDPTHVLVYAQQLCGAHNAGPGALLSSTLRVHLVKPGA